MDNTSFSGNINVKDATVNSIPDKTDLYANEIFPTLVNRVKALVVDWIVILIIFTMASLIINQFPDTPNWVRGFVLIFSLYLYEPTLIYSMGGTLGHQLTGLRVRKFLSPEKKLNFLESSIRFFTKYLFGWISFLTVIGDRRKRAIHDMTSRSIVLFKRR